MNSNKDHYEVTDGRRVEIFPYTLQGLHDAWLVHRLMRFSQLINPNRVDLLEADSDRLSDGLIDEEHEMLDEFESEEFRLLHADEIAEDFYWQARLDEARGK